MTRFPRHTQPDSRSTAVPARIRRTHTVPRSNAMTAPARRTHHHVRSSAMPEAGRHVHTVPRSTGMSTPARTSARVARLVCPAGRALAVVARRSRSGSNPRSTLPAQLQARWASIGAVARWGQIADEQALTGCLRGGGISIETNTSRWGCRRAA